jgi:hypothetical protein
MRELGLLLQIDPNRLFAVVGLGVLFWIGLWIVAAILLAIEENKKA